MEFRRPRGSELGQDRMPKDICRSRGGHARFGTDTPTRAPERGQIEMAQVRVANPANSRITQAAAGCRDTAGEAGDRPVRIRNADPDVSGTLVVLDTTDDLPVHV